MTLFDVSAMRVRPAAAAFRLNLDALARYAFCYTGTASGNCSGIRFAATVEDAQKWCESDLSRGTMHGTAWAYFWTRVPTFLDVFAPPLDITGYVDSGEWDERIASTGCVKIDLRDFAETFAPFGLAVVT